MISRRGLIKLGAASVGTMALRPFGLIPALAQSGSADYRALVCIFLYGGNDSNNTIIPADDVSMQAYQKIRGSLALGSADVTGTVYAQTGNAPYVFHSALSDLANMFSNKELAVVANVGPLVQPTSRSQYLTQSAPVPSNLYSHSDQQGEWQTATYIGPARTGWAGRVADLASSQNRSPFPTFFSVAGNAQMGVGANTSPVALAPGQSLDLQGFSSASASQARLAALKKLLTLNSGVQLAQASNSIVLDSIADAQSLDNALSKSAPLKTVFPKTALGAQLQQIAQVIQVRDGLGMSRQIFFASLGGFDTHANELEALKVLYPQLGQAMRAFSDAMNELGTAGNVTTFTESDFSRTFQPTTSDGSDHAWGSHHMVMGGAVKGGDIYGQFPQFILSGPNDAESGGRWIPTISVDQYGATLSSWFGIDDANLVQVFPNISNFGSKTKLSFLG